LIFVYLLKATSRPMRGSNLYTIYADLKDWLWACFWCNMAWYHTHKPLRYYIGWKGSEWSVWL